MENRWVQIVKLSNSMLQINGDEGSLHSLYLYFTEYVDGYMFAPAFKEKRWDGKKHFMTNCKLPYGLLFYCIEFCKSILGIEPELQDFGKEDFGRALPEDIDDILSDNLVNWEHTLKDYQEDSIKVALSKKRGIILSATGSGKSVILYSCVRTLLKEGKSKILLIVPNIGLVDQMYKDFADYGWEDIDTYVERMHSKLPVKYKPTFKKRVLISTYDSLKLKKPYFFEDYEAVLIDECHKASTPSILKILEHCINADIRIGVTGTLKDSRCEKFAVYSQIGPVLKITKSKELIEKGDLSDILITSIFLHYPMSICKEVKEFMKAEEWCYDFENRLIEEFADRMLVLKEILNNVDENDNTLILCTHREHQKKIVDFLKKEYPKRDISMINGDTKASEREEVRQSTNMKDGAIIVASYQTYAVGVNINKLHNVILFHSSKSKIRILQSIGRGLRKHKSKSQVVIWDIVDDMRVPKKDGTYSLNYNINNSIKQYKERHEHYVNEGFEELTADFFLEDLAKIHKE